MNVKDIHSYPTVCEELSDIFIKHDSVEKYKFEKPYPIENTIQDSKTKKCVGHIVYCPNRDELVYQTKRRQDWFLWVVDGKGVAIDEKIINNLKEYNVKTVYIGQKENNNVYVIPLDKFNNKWDKSETIQKYARLDTDVIYEYQNKMGILFTNIPRESERSITITEYKNKFKNQ